MEQPPIDLAKLAAALVDAAAIAQARQDNSPTTEANLRHYRDDARAVAAAVLRKLAGGPAGFDMVTQGSLSVRLRDLIAAVKQTAA